MTTAAETLAAELFSAAEKSGLPAADVQTALTLAAKRAAALTGKPAPITVDEIIMAINQRLRTGEATLYSSGILPR